MFTNETIAEIEKAAAQAGIERAALLAVAELESGGRAYALVKGRKEPLVRFEGHYFDRRLTGAARDRARRAGLSSPQAGVIANPAGQPARWDMIARAAEIDRKAAYESVSWGIGQVMGAHWAWLGYASVEALVAEARGGVGGQMRLMIRYIAKAGLAEALAARDWDSFARGYNGPAYRRNGYHTRLAAAWRKHGGGGTGNPYPTAVLLRRGDSGGAVKDLQVALSGAGYPLQPDGRFGPLTDAALRKFQRDSGLAADGIAGASTLDALRDLLSPRQRLRRWWMRLRAFLADLLTQRRI